MTLWKYLRAGAPLVRLREMACVPHVMRARSAYGNAELGGLRDLEHQVNRELDALAREYEAQR